MSITLTIDTYLKELTLLHDSDLIKKILYFLENRIDTVNATGNEEKIAKLFCRTVESLDQDAEIEEDLENSIISAFENIRTIENNTHENGELMCIYLLNLLFSKQGYFDQVSDDDFKLLLDNLERIRLLFKFKDTNDQLYFPIGNLLFKLINSENLWNEIEKASSIQALMLALQIFDKSQYPQQLKDIEEMIKGKDLRFIEYLYRKCYRIGNNDWKENYEKNGLLILYDPNGKKVLVRNHSKKYFETSYDISDYKFPDVVTEKNANNESIAFFVEYPLENFKSVDLSKELSRENNKDHISQIIDIIYYHKNYNIIFTSALFEKEGRIYPINPFGTNDEYVIYKGDAYKDGKRVVSEFLYQYGLLQVTGTGLKYVNLGLIVKLNEIYSISFDEFELESNSSMDEIIGNWLERCNDKQKCFNEFMKDYVDQIKYIYKQNDIYQKKYEREYLIPCHISKGLLDKLQLDDKLTSLNLEKCSISIDMLQNEIKIIDSKENTLEDYGVEDIAGESIKLSDGETVALVDNENKKIFVGRQVDYYYLMLNKLNQINNSVLHEEVINKVYEDDILNIATKMLCFKDALSNIHPGLPMESIARYRVLNHLLLIKIRKDNIRQWIDLINKHEIVNYAVASDNNPIKSSEGVLYVPKDRGRRQSTLKYVNDRYFNKSNRRSTVDIYDQLITKKGNYYYIGDKKIQRIVLLFDIIQNGTATKKTIDYYINRSKPSDGKLMPFYCNGKEVTVNTILNTNKCSIEIYSIFAGDTGIEEVKRHVKTMYPHINITVSEPVKKLTRIVNNEDVDLIKKFYPNNMSGGIKEKCYLIVREFNQPKKNVMCDNLLEIERVVAIFCKREEL